MTPQQELDFLRPAFLDLFQEDHPDLSRFLRLVIDVLDPFSRYRARCKGDGFLLPTGCGELVDFIVADENGHPYAYKCPKCGAEFLWSLCKGPKELPKRVVLTSDGGSNIGRTKSESDSGVVITDNDTVIMPVIK